MKMIAIAMVSLGGLLAGLARGQSTTDPARELKQIQEQREKETASALEPINRRYTAALEQVLRRAMQTGDLDTANKARLELQKLGVTASTTGAGAGTPLGQTDETRRAALRARLRDSKWKMAGGKAFELLADGTTTSSWHKHKGVWRVTGPNTAELSINNAETIRKATFNDDATAVTLGEGSESETATRISSPN